MRWRRPTRPWLAPAVLVGTCALCLLGSLARGGWPASTSEDSPPQAVRTESSQVTPTGYDDGTRGDVGTDDAPLGTSVSAVPGDEGDATTEALVRTMVDEGARSVTWTERGDVEQVATRLLVAYRDGEPCALAQAGYIDLVGNAWSCVVQGAGWVDICVVREQEGTSTVVVMRLEGEAVAAALMEEGE